MKTQKKDNKKREREREKSPFAPSQLSRFRGGQRSLLTQVRAPNRQVGTEAREKATSLRPPSLVCVRAACDAASSKCRHRRIRMHARTDLSPAWTSQNFWFVFSWVPCELWTPEDRVGYRHVERAFSGYRTLRARWKCYGQPNKWRDKR